MKNLEILIELVGELRAENASLKEKLIQKEDSTSFWYEKFIELEKSSTVTLTNQN